MENFPLVNGIDITVAYNTMYKQGQTANGEKWTQ